MCCGFAPNHKYCPESILIGLLDCRDSSRRVLLEHHLSRDAIEYKEDPIANVTVMGINQEILDEDGVQF